MSPLHDDWAAIAYVTASQSLYTVLIRDDRYKNLVHWKLPGGKKEPWEQTPQETVLRELYEETGLRGMNTRLLCRQNRTTHDMYLFHVEVPDYTALLPIGADGEVTQLFLQTDVRKGLSNFFPSHVPLLQQTGVLVA